jgi:hypothetical protein
MSAAEFGQRWLPFFEKHGRCSLARMFDFGPALIAWKIDHAIGGATDITDYMPHYKAQEQEASVADIFKAFGGVKQRG